MSEALEDFLLRRVHDVEEIRQERTKAEAANRDYQRSRLYSTPPVYGERDDRRKTGNYGLTHMIMTITMLGCFEAIIHHLQPSDALRVFQTRKAFGSCVEAAAAKIVRRLHSLLFNRVPLPSPSTARRTFHLRQWHELVAGIRPWVKYEDDDEASALCVVCFTDVNGEYGPADLRLACGCCTHYFCLTQHARYVIGDRSIVQAHGGVKCPNAGAGGTCALKGGEKEVDGKVDSGGGGGGAGAEKGGSSLIDADQLLSIGDIIVSSSLGQAALRVWMADEMRISQADKFFFSKAQADSLQYFLRPPDPKPTAPIDPYIQSMMKSCPNECGAFLIHFHGHHDHAVTCPLCRIVFCWSCGATSIQNVELRGAHNLCLCGSYWQGCRPLRSVADIASFLVLEPFPHDTRCGCAICPDCKEGSPCEWCASADGDWNCAVCSGFLRCAPRQRNPDWVPQTDEMRVKSANEQPAPVYDDEARGGSENDEEEEEV